MILRKQKEPVAPFLRGGASSRRIMLCVILALLPAAITGCLNYGLSAAALLGVTVGTAALSELLFRAVTRKQQTVQDFSAVVTGLLLGMTLPPDFPLWKAAIGSAFAIIIVKQLFGGIGKNFANPAATAKILLMVLFMDDMTVWRLPLTDSLFALPDNVQTASAVVTQTPLTGAHATYWDLLLGNTAGNIGETCALGILLGAVFLWLTRISSPVAPLTCIGSFTLLTALGGYDVPAQLLSGGFLLGACFMTTDYTTVPVTRGGKCLFGLGCGVLTFLIRHYGGYPEGIPFAIVMMNLLTPYLERFTKPHPFGAAYPVKKKRSVSER